MCQEGILGLLGAGSWSVGRAQRKSWEARDGMETTATYQPFTEEFQYLTNIWMFWTFLIPG